MYLWAIPLAAILPAIVSITLVGAVPPRQRYDAIARSRTSHELAPQTPPPTPSAPAASPAQSNRWLLPLLLGLLIGNAWGNDDRGIRALTERFANPKSLGSSAKLHERRGVAQGEGGCPATGK